MRALTDTKIRSLKPASNEKPYDVKDTQVPGLRVRVLGSGQRTFVLLGRFPASPHPTRRALGVYGDSDAGELPGRRQPLGAADPAGHRSANMKEERERQAALRQQRTTFAAVAEDFIKDKLPGERKCKEIERDIRREFLPRWGKRPIAEITASGRARCCQGGEGPWRAISGA